MSSPRCRVKPLRITMTHTDSAGVSFPNDAIEGEERRKVDQRPDTRRKNAIKGSGRSEMHSFLDRSASPSRGCWR